MKNSSKESILMRRDVLQITYDSFEEYAGHLEKLEDRRYKAIKVTATHTSEKVYVKYERYIEVAEEE